MENAEYAQAVLEQLDAETAARVAAMLGVLVGAGRFDEALSRTGLAGGDHLHLEIFIQGQSVDPLEWLDAKWIRDNLASKLDVPVE